MQRFDTNNRIQNREWLIDKSKSENDPGNKTYIVLSF